MTEAALVPLLAIHAGVALGWKVAAAFAAVCLLITFSVEDIGLATGFPFGRYAFLAFREGWHVGAVPAALGPAYFALAYQAWTIAGLLVDLPGTRSRRAPLFAVPAVAAFTMTQWDLVFDPPSSTVGRVWVWLDGGGFLGVPFSNFLGWLLECWILFQLFACISPLLPPSSEGCSERPGFLAWPVLTFLASGLSRLVPLRDAGHLVVDGAGRAWNSGDVQTAAAVVAAFTVIPTACLALFRLSRRSMPQDERCIR